MLNKILGSIGIEKLVDSVSDAADKLITTKEEKEQLRIELEAVLYKDRASARQMYMENSSLQKIYALAFLIFYFLLTAGALLIVFLIAYQKIVLANWIIAFISSIWGGMSTKISTITDFLFGSSKGSQDKTHLIKTK